MNTTVRLTALAALLGLSACSPDAQVATSPAAGTGATPAMDMSSHHHELPTVVVYKSQLCGCCELWAEYMQKAGYAVEVVNTEDLDAVKARVGVPSGMGSCHTAEVDGYFIEGHVPASDVTRLLMERPAIRGLAVAGMPMGSPGMEQGGVPQPYDVIAVAKDGSGSVFTHHGS